MLSQSTLARSSTHPSLGKVKAVGANMSTEMDANMGATRGAEVSPDNIRMSENGRVRLRVKTSNLLNTYNTQTLHTPSTKDRHAAEGLVKDQCG